MRADSLPNCVGDGVGHCDQLARDGGCDLRPGRRAHADGRPPRGAWKRLFDEYLGRGPPGPESPSAFDSAPTTSASSTANPATRASPGFLESRGSTCPSASPPTRPRPRPCAASATGRTGTSEPRSSEKGEGDPYPTTLALIEQLRNTRRPERLIVSSSRNCQAVLEAAGIEALFDAKVDGLDAEELALPGEARSRRLRRSRTAGLAWIRFETAVVEDAIVGVEAGRRGRFGLVVGVDRRAAVGSAETRRRRRGGSRSGRDRGI